MTENISKTIKVFYMHHQDGLNRLSPVLLLDGGRIWQTAVKRRIRGNPMYYVFYQPHSYLKLWKDSKGHLLFFLDNFVGDLFFAEEPQLIQINRELNWDDNSLTWRDVKLKFTVPIFSLVTKIDMWLSAPVAAILFELFGLDRNETCVTQNPAQDSGQNPSQG